MSLLTVPLVALLALASAQDSTTTCETRWWKNWRIRYAVYLAVAFAGIGSCWWAWGGVLHPLPIIHDEFAYLLQARIFAKGQLTAPPWPDPEMFRQWHVFGTPRVAAKYFPGHSLLLVPGMWLGMPALVPFLLAGGAAACLLLLVSSLHGPLIGLLTCFLWLTSSHAMRHMASYYSETSAVVAWLLAWISLRRWQITRQTRWFCAACAAAAAALVIRPFSAVSLGIALTVAVLFYWRMFRFTRRTILASVACATVIIGLAMVILGISNLSLTGDVTTSAFTRYTRETLTYDRLGFGLNKRATSRTAEEFAFNSHFEWIHGNHTVARLPGQAWERLKNIADGTWGAAWPVGIVTAIYGIAICPSLGRFWALTFLLLFASYLFYAHPPIKTLYYVEVMPPLMYLSVVGTFAGVSAIFKYFDGLRRLMSHRVVKLTLFATASALIPICAFMGLYDSRQLTHSFRRYHLLYDQAESALPPGKKTIVIRYGPRHSPWRSLVQNNPFLPQEDVWRVHDVGKRRISRFMRAHPDRAGYLFMEDTWTFYRLDRDGNISDL